MFLFGWGDDEWLDRADSCRIEVAVEIKQLHRWDVTTAEAREIQRDLAARVIRTDEIGEVRMVAGVDMALGRFSRIGRGAVVVLDYPSLAVREVQVVEVEIQFPYIPGLLSFREAPVVLQAFARLSSSPDLVFVDGQGIAHPRRFGIASHLGVLLDTPTIGCAKSILVGHQGELGLEAGSVAPLVDRDEVVGMAVRTKAKVKPVYASIGHKVDLDAAVHWILACRRGYRLPEPTRLAHQAAGGASIVDFQT
ncbi:MAG: deoxyribonuclease V [Dehalococcoidales bacterium]|nr:deoxyribonuclease V [Dehalococcoidales bacterium]